MNIDQHSAHSISMTKIGSLAAEVGNAEAIIGNGVMDNLDNLFIYLFVCVCFAFQSSFTRGKEERGNS